MSLTCENCGVEVDDNVRLRRERDDALARCRTSAQIMIEAIGASGPESVEETARRAAAKIDGARAEAHRFREERDDLRGQLYGTREDRQRLGRELDEARTELEEVRATRDDALVKLECLDDHRRADSQLIDRITTERDEVAKGRDEALEKVDVLIANARSDEHEIDRITAALLNLIDSVTATKTRDAIVLRDIEAARALIGEVRS